MGENTKIEWADHTFNPWVGCAKVSEACRDCYAESWAKRTGQDALWRGERRRTSGANWRKPLQWNRDTPGARVFCASLADVFEDRADLVPWRHDLMDLIRATPNLTWLLLTKRPDVAARWFDEYGCPENVWVGATVENQQRADERIPHLLRIPAPVRFLSMEPLLGPVDLSRWMPRGRVGWMCQGCDTYFAGQHVEVCPDCDAKGWWTGSHYGNGRPNEQPIGWVITGGESGGRARPSHPCWFRSLRDQCETAGVPFHFKQWGEWGPIRSQPTDTCPASGNSATLRGYESVRSHDFGDAIVERWGKVRAGRLLDGRTWDGLP